MFIAYSRDYVHKEIGTTKQLFVDDDVVASVRNVTRRQHTPRKHPSNPLISNDQPWETTAYFRTSAFNVVWDPADRLFKCWYEDVLSYFGVKGGVGLTDARVCYAQSEDGLNWEKPSLGKHYLDGQDTNVVFDLAPDGRARTPTIVLDEHEEDPARRFKMMYVHYIKRPGPPEGLRADAHSFPVQGLYGVGLSIAYSQNGIDWTPFEGNPVIPYWAGDVEILTYDPIDEKYVLYGRARKWTSAPRPGFGGEGIRVWPSKPEGVWNTRRCVYRVESKDCANWSEPVMAFEAGEADNLDDGLYGFVPWRVDEMHLGILNVLHQVDNVMEMYLLYGRDGSEWKRFPEHRPLIPRGPTGSYDHLGVETPTQPLVVGDEMWIYYGGTNVHHDYWISGQAEGIDLPEVHDPALSENGHHLCLATLRLDGWVSLEATVREGLVETKPLFSTASRLFINARCEPDGYVEVEMADTWGNAWEGYARQDCQTFTGDSVRHQVTWSGHETVNEEPFGVKLKFFLRKAELYGFQFAGSYSGAGAL